MKDVCEQEELHRRRIAAALEVMPAEEQLYEMAARFKAISEPSRLRILFVLAGGELCVEHITMAVDGNQSAVSHQLKILKDNKIVKSRRCGKNVLYSVSDDHVLKTAQLAKEHLNCNE